jgi:site-specific DNA-cytosine methylase
MSIWRQVENDPAAQQVLKAQFPGTLLLSDVCAVERLPEGIDLLAAGFPCPDVSRLGLREGIQGDRTGLVRHVFRLLHHQKVPPPTDREQNDPRGWVANGQVSRRHAGWQRD